MSYEYLNQARLKVFKLAKEVGRVAEDLIPLTPESVSLGRELKTFPAPYMMLS